MLYVCTGSDTATAKEKVSKLVEGREEVRFGEGAEPFEHVLGYLGARGIFSAAIALILDRPLDGEEGKIIFENNLKDFADADALVVIIQPELPAELKKKIPKAASIESFDYTERDEVVPPNIFALTDAFAAGDRKKVWILYRKFLEEGMAPEEIHGALAWQARALVLASKTNNAIEAGLKPFVYTKAKRFVSKLTPSKTEKLSRELVFLYHEARAGRGSLADLLEVFLLKKIQN